MILRLLASLRRTNETTLIRISRINLEMAQRKTRPPRIRLRANVIAENIYSQVDADGHHSLVIDEIIDHSKNGNTVPTDIL